MLLRLTAEGRALKTRALGVPQAIACATACDLKQIQDLSAQLQQLRRHLNDFSNPAA